jgi:hypothetical protein
MTSGGPIVKPPCENEPSSGREKSAMQIHVHAPRRPRFHRISPFREGGWTAVSGKAAKKMSPGTLERFHRAVVRVKIRFSRTPCSFSMEADERRPLPHLSNDYSFASSPRGVGNVYFTI